jgi:hypothetical protein
MVKKIANQNFGIYVRFVGFKGVKDKAALKNCSKPTDLLESVAPKRSCRQAREYARKSGQRLCVQPRQREIKNVVSEESRSDLTLETSQGRRWQLFCSPEAVYDDHLKIGN